jgi:hypothetical protein
MYDFFDESNYTNNCFIDCINAYNEREWNVEKIDELYILQVSHILKGKWTVWTDAIAPLAKILGITVIIHTFENAGDKHEVR